MQSAGLALSPVALPWPRECAWSSRLEDERRVGESESLQWTLEPSLNHPVGSQALGMLVSPARVSRSTQPAIPDA